MKKVFSLVVVTIISATVYSQTSKGNWLAGGAASFASQSQSGSNNLTNVTIAPTFGYFIGKNLAVGGTLNFGSQKSGSFSFTRFGIGPMARYYFAELGKNAKLYGQGEFAYASVSNGTTTSSGTGWALQAGPAFFLNKNVAIETTLRYGSVKTQNAAAVNTFGVNVGFQIHL